MPRYRKIEQLKKLEEAGGLPLPPNLRRVFRARISNADLEDLIIWVLQMRHIYREAGAEHGTVPSPPHPRVITDEESP